MKMSCFGIKWRVLVDFKPSAPAVYVFN
jgi:hypothetical protein